MSPKARVFWPLVLLIPLADCSTKGMAVERLSPMHVPHGVFGSVVQFTLAYNPGMAFGIDLRPYLGSWARPLFVIAASAIILMLMQLYRRAAPSARLLALALALTAGGAIGNLIDRVRSAAGVVDFIDVGIGARRFWTFNVADAGITIGAAILALLIWREGRRAADVRSYADTAQ